MPNRKSTRSAYASKRLFTSPTSNNVAQGLESILWIKFGRLPEIKGQFPTRGSTIKLQDKSRYHFYPITKRNSLIIMMVWEVLLYLRVHVLESKVQKLAIPKIECNQLDDQRIVKTIMEVILQDTKVQILVCNHTPNCQRPGYSEDRSLLLPRNWKL